MARYLIWGAGLAAAALAFIALARYPGSAAAFLLFNVCFFACVGLLLPRPRLYVYTFLALLLALGLWAKTMMHTLWQFSFLEPVGGFANTPQEWDRALFAMSAAALGLIAARAAHLWHARRHDRAGRTPARMPVPPWFLRHRRALWVLTALGIVAVNAANLHFAFYQIGVNVKWILPLRLHVLLAWLVNIGFALWLSALLWWEVRRAASALAPGILAAFLEALASSISAFSRILYLVHAAPYWLALWQERRPLAGAIHRRSIAVLGIGFAAFFVASLFAVFLLRASFYPANADLGRNIKLEIPQLALQRWVGLEGVLAVGAVSGRSLQMLGSALADSPKLGTDSLYQRVARTRYTADETRTFSFGTNAGPLAILLFSGSLAMVFAGMALITLVLIATEESTLRWTGNPFLAAVAAAALANVVSQTTFFYLTAIFLLQLWLAIALIGTLERLRR